MIEAGRYLGKADLTGIEIGMTGKEGSKNLVMQIPFNFTIEVKGPDGKPAPKAARLIKKLWFHGGASPVSKRALHALGLSADKTLKQARLEGWACLSNEVELEIIKKEYPAGSGKFQNEIDFINIPGAMTVDPITDDALDALDSKLAALTDAIKMPSKSNGGGTAAAGGGSAGAVKPAADDDLPF